MIWSVSTLLYRSGTPMPVWRLNFSIAPSVSAVRHDHRRRPVWRADPSTVMGSADRRFEVGRRRQCAAHAGRCGDQRADQMSTSALALSTLEVPVRRGGTALAGRELVRVHAQAH